MQRKGRMPSSHTGLLLLTNLVAFAAGACQSAPQPRVIDNCDPEIVVKRRAIELTPLVVASPQMDNSAVELLRQRFREQLINSGAFELVEPGTQTAEFVVSAVISDVGVAADPIADLDLGVDEVAPENRWSMRLLVEVRAASDRHLLGVIGASYEPSIKLMQVTGQDVEKKFSNNLWRVAALQIVQRATASLCARYGPTAKYEDPAVLGYDVLFAQGQSAYAEGAFYDAEAMLLAALEKSENSALVASMLGDIYYNRSDFVRAVELYNRAIDMEASRFREMTLLGNAHYYLLDYDRAARIWKNALTLDPNNAAAKTLKANIRRALDKTRKSPKGRGLRGVGGSKQPDDEF